MTYLKLFGISLDEVNKLIDSIDETGFLNAVVSYENFVVVIACELNQNNRMVFAKIVQALNEYIFTDQDESCFERLFSLLKLRKKSISLCEQGSGGIVCAELSKLDDSELFVRDCMTLNNIGSFVSRFDVKPSLMSHCGLANNTSAYAICSAFASRTIADLCVVTLSNLEQTGFAVFGQTFVAVSSEKGIDLRRYQFSGKKADIIQQTAIATCFQLIKQLK